MPKRYQRCKVFFFLIIAGLFYVKKLYAGKPPSPLSVHDFIYEIDLAFIVYESS